MAVSHNRQIDFMLVEILHTLKAHQGVLWPNMDDEFGANSNIRSPTLFPLPLRSSVIPL